MSRNRPINELEFFDHVKRHLNHNEQAYAEFLKCLNWYSQDILKKSELVKLIQNFIGRSDELFSWFKQFVGYVESENETSSRHAEPELSDPFLPDLSSCKRLGSYRFLPKNYQFAVCSGRTPLCHEILNDSLVSCPSFNSEDSTFVSSKKNPYEEDLFRCEDERYELDRLIDGNQVTIASFEPLLRKMQAMTAREIERFTLTDSLGGTSEVIYRNIIQRIYGPKSDEVLDALKKSPLVALPIVLKRLKQKDEEWRIAQREWNKVWRDIHFKNYYKALDHQGINFKTNDKKILLAKGLVNEIQTIYYEQLRGHLSPAAHLLPSSQGLGVIDSTGSPPLPFMSAVGNARLSNQLEFKIGDKAVLEDLFRLILHLNAKLSSHTSLEKRSVDKFIVNFIPDFFSYKVVSMEGGRSGLAPAESTDDSAEEIPDVLSSASSKSNKLSPVLSAPSTPERILKLRLEPKSSEAKNESEFAVFKSNLNIIYGNESIYTFFRLFQIAYHRLEQMKVIAYAYPDKPLYHHKKNYIASFLDLQKKPSGGFPMDADYYKVLLELLFQLIEGGLDQNAYEEKIRLMFGTHAYLMFTFDRLIYSLLKQALAIIGDTTSKHLVALYDSFKRPKKGLVFSEYSYKVAARSLLGSDPGAGYSGIPAPASQPSSGNGGQAIETQESSVFRIEAQKDAKTSNWWLKFRYLGFGTGTDNSKMSPQEKWSTYIDQFIDVHYDPILLTRKPPILLTKLLKGMKAERLRNMTIEYNLECKICVNTFKMFFVDHSEDFIYNPTEREPKPGEVSTRYLDKRVGRFRAWLEAKRVKVIQEKNVMEVDSGNIASSR